MKKIISKIKNKLKEIIIKVKFVIVFPLSFLGKVEKNKCVVCAFSGRGYIDNPQSIAEELYKRNQKYKIVCLVKEVDNTIPKYVIQKKYTPYNIIRELSTAEIWIDNERKIYPVHKKRNQIYMQTWHGGLFSLKKVEKDVENELPKYYVKYAKKDSKKIDVLISDSDFRTNLYRKSFWYAGEILQIGQPRNDIMYDKEMHKSIKEELLSKLKLNYDTNILLYAPTIRKKFNKDVFELDYEMLEKELREKFKGQWKILVKLHPAIAHKSRELDLEKFENVIDVTEIKDMQKLLISADILITDYSSTLFDYLILEKKAFIFAKDLKEYEIERGHYFDFKKMPIPIAESNLELCQNIKNFDENKFLKDIYEFFNQYGVSKGNAAKEAADWLENKLESRRGII